MACSPLPTSDVGDVPLIDNVGEDDDRDDPMVIEWSEPTGDAGESDASKGAEVGVVTHHRDFTDLAYRWRPWFGSSKKALTS